MTVSDIRINSRVSDLLAGWSHHCTWPWLRHGYMPLSMLLVPMILQSCGQDIYFLPQDKHKKTCSMFEDLAHHYFIITHCNMPLGFLNFTWWAPIFVIVFTSRLWWNVWPFARHSTVTQIPFSEAFQLISSLSAGKRSFAMSALLCIASGSRLGVCQLKSFKCAVCSLAVLANLLASGVPPDSW